MQTTRRRGFYQTGRRPNKPREGELHSRLGSGTLAATQRSGRLLAAIVAAGVLASLAGAQPIPQDPRQRLRRNAEDRPQNRQQFEEALRKFRSEELRERLEGIEAMGAVEREPRAVEYLLEASNDQNPTVRVKAIDTLGTMHRRDSWDGREIRYMRQLSTVFPLMDDDRPTAL